jgi:short-subunit dehydrogenase
MAARDLSVVITGASSGIGYATALRFASRGARLTLVARGEDALDDAVTACRALGADVVGVPADVTSQRAVEAVAHSALERSGRIDVWINCASVSVFGPFLDIPPEDFRRVIEVDQLGYVNGARVAIAAMTSQGRGTLVNVASVVGEIPQPYAAPYAMSKAAVRALSVSLRQELRLSGLKKVHVVTVSPPTIDTPFFRHAGNYSGRRVQAMPPVYAADPVARAIVSLATSKHPDAEHVVGRAGRALARQHRVHPESAEAMMAVQTDTAQLSRTRQAPATTGTLYEPSDTVAAVSDGWHGARRTWRRGLLGWLAVGTVAFAIARSLRRH